MNESKIPYLCGGTFFNLLSAMKKQENVEGNDDPCMFTKLISVFHLDSKFMPTVSESTLKNYTSRYANCKETCNSITSLNKKNLISDFDSDVKSTESKALHLMKEFVDKHLLENNYTLLVYRLRCMIRDDESISDDAEFYIQGNRMPVKKK